MMKKEEELVLQKKELENSSTGNYASALPSGIPSRCKKTTVYTQRNSLNKFNEI
jgi:hypothetical protein